MTHYRIGAIAYALWGIAHLVGGAMLLAAATQGTEAFAFALSGKPTAIPSILVATQVFQYHAFNIAWIGLTVLLVAVLLGWRNSAKGFWINLALVGFADLGLLVFMVRPGIISIGEASIGLGLFALAFIFSWQGRRRATV